MPSQPWERAIGIASLKEAPGDVDHVTGRPAACAGRPDDFILPAALRTRP
jgi:hypothetical protein